MSAARSTSRDELKALRRLARACGVQTQYDDCDQRRRVARPEALVAVLRSLGQPIERPADARAALQQFERDRDSRRCDPVLVAWDGRLPMIRVRGSSSALGGPLPAVIHLEDGGQVNTGFHAVDGREPSPDGAASFESTTEPTLPVGVHDMTLSIEGRDESVHVLSAPRRCWGGAGQPPADLGVFLPLYALQSARSWGAGDLADLESLMRWTAAHGGRYVGVLPMLASFLDEPFEPSPYSPVSRLFWNELFLDVTGAPDLDRSSGARTLIESGRVREAIGCLRAAPLVEHRQIMRLKREVLEAIAGEAWSNERRRDELEQFARCEPHLDDYATYRAAAERHGGTFHDWPQRQRDGEIREGDYDETARRYHVYVQWQFRNQIERLAPATDDEGTELYLDLPVGVHGGGFDAWRFREIFAADTSVGAPPDPFFTGGQDWGFPPIDPRRSRLDGHRYFRLAIRNHLRFSGLLRLDHVMGLHRLFWIPHGLTAADGVYVRYAHEELYAILSMESHRWQARVVGENLGTVPGEVNRAMRRHGLLRMSIGQFEFRDDKEKAIPATPADSLTALNTHDMPTFAAFWTGADIDQRVELGLLDIEEATGERAGRERLRASICEFLVAQGLLASTEATEMRVFEAILAHAAASEARVQILNLEDAWQELEPQNVPGIGDAYPSWRRRARRSLEEIVEDEQLGDLVRTLATLRGGVEHPPESKGEVGGRRDVLDDAAVPSKIETGS